jgi:IS5 family transposase
MRKKSKKQMPLTPPKIDHSKADELETISHMLDDNPTILDCILKDLNRGRVEKRSGARGMSADQVLRAALVKQMFGFSYRDLAFHIEDSASVSRFLRIGFGDRPFKHSALAKNIKMISPETWEEINRVLLAWATSKGIEKGRQVRVDCTVVETDIHAPTDSSLLYDSVRVLCRILGEADARWGGCPHQDHRRRAKRRLMNILNAKNNKARLKPYRDLLKVTGKAAGYAEHAITQLEQIGEPEALGYALELKHYLDLTRRVIDQTERRVLNGEKVPSSEKVVSIFEPHTDIIVKDRRDTYYGHKVCLCVGASQLITDCLITSGNPADTDLTETMLDRQNDIYGRYPLKAALDGGFASKANLKAAKDKGIKDVCFAKKRGLEVLDMCRSEWVYKRLRNFRAGVESVISRIKRSLGFDRCTWKGLRSFGSYVWLSAVAANLRTLACLQMT